MEAHICPYCEEAIQEQDFKAQAPCGTLFHTPCFLYLRPQRNGHIEQCEPCFALFYPDDNEEVEEEVVEEDNHSVQSNTVTVQHRIVNMWNTNEEFRKDIKSYQAAYRGVCQPLTDFRKLLRTKKEELKPRFTLIKAQYEGLSNLKKEEIKLSPEYKNYMKALSKETYYVHKLRRVHNVRRSDFYFLNHIQGLRRLRYHRSYWRSSPQYMIRRTLRLNLRS